MNIACDKIVIVGTSGSGKSFLAKQLSQRLSLPHIELDALNWDPGWVEAEPEVFARRVATALAVPGWIVDGNYMRVKEIVWAQAETIIWLDYSLPRVLKQLFVRTLSRLLGQKELWNGNRERFTAQFTKDSIILWAIQTHAKNRRRSRELFTSSEYQHLRRVRLTSPAATRRWLAGLSAADFPRQS